MFGVQLCRLLVSRTCGVPTAVVAIRRPIARVICSPLRRFASHSGPSASHSVRLAAVKMFRVELQSAADSLSPQSKLPPRLLTAAILNDPELLRSQVLDSIPAAGESFLVNATHLPALTRSLDAPASASPALLAAPKQSTSAGAPAAAAANTALTSTTDGSAVGFALPPHIKPMPLSAVYASQNAAWMEKLSGGDTATNELRAAAAASQPAPLSKLHTRWLDAARNGDLSAMKELWTAECERRSKLQSATAATTTAAGDALDVNIRHPRHGGTALHEAAMNGYPDIIRFLLAAPKPAAAVSDDGGSDEGGCGVDPNARATNDSTALHWACGTGSIEAVEALLQFGVSRGLDPALRSHTWTSTVFGKGSGQTAASWAAESGYTPILDILHRYAPHVLTAIDERGQTPTHLAIREARTSTVRWLTERTEKDAYVAVRIKLEWSTVASLPAAGPRNNASSNSAQPQLTK